VLAGYIVGDVTYIAHDVARGCNREGCHMDPAAVVLSTVFIIIGLWLAIWP
jgi:hypothetical protein